MITIDGVEYKIGIIKLTRKATINYENHGTTLDGIEHADPLGTYYDYEATIKKQGRFDYSNRPLL